MCIGKLRLDILTIAISIVNGSKLPISMTHCDLCRSDLIKFRYKVGYGRICLCDSCKREVELYLKLHNHVGLNTGSIQCNDHCHSLAVTRNESSSECEVISRLSDIIRWPKSGTGIEHLRGLIKILQKKCCQCKHFQACCLAIQRINCNKVFEYTSAPLCYICFQNYSFLHVPYPEHDDLCQCGYPYTSDGCKFD